MPRRQLDVGRRRQRRPDLGDRPAHRRVQVQLRAAVATGDRLHAATQVGTGLTCARDRRSHPGRHRHIECLSRTDDFESIVYDPSARRPLRDVGQLLHGRPRPPTTRSTPRSGSSPVTARPLHADAVAGAARGRGPHRRRMASGVGMYYGKGTRSRPTTSTRTRSAPTCRCPVRRHRRHRLHRREHRVRHDRDAEHVGRARPRRRTRRSTASTSRLDLDRELSVWTVPARRDDAA